MNRQRMLSLMAGAALAFFIADRLVITPLVKSWKTRSARIAELRKRVAQGDVLVEREEAIRERWAMMRTNALSREVSVAESQLLNAFEEWSRISGAGITAIRPQWKRNEDSMTLECRADAFGSLASLTRFLYMVEKDPLGVKIDSIELSPRDKRANELNLILQVSGLMLQPPGS